MNSPESFRKPNTGMQEVFQREASFDAGALLAEAQSFEMDAEALIADRNSGKEIDEATFSRARLKAREIRDHLKMYEIQYTDSEQKKMVVDLENSLTRFIEKTE
jgi:hypothetical protein